MRKLTDFMDEIGITNQIIAGLGKLVNEDKALDILETMDDWRVVTNHRSTTRHGQCRYRTKELELHAMLHKPGNEAARDRVTIHEIAHVVAPLVYGQFIKGHGREWKHIMRCFGASPDRCCSSNDEMNQFKLKKAKIIYACSRCEREFPAQRKKKYGLEHYIHKRCGGHLYLKENRVTGYRAP